GLGAFRAAERDVQPAPLSRLHGFSRDLNAEGVPAACPGQLDELAGAAPDVEQARPAVVPHAVEEVQEQTVPSCVDPLAGRGIHVDVLEIVTHGVARARRIEEDEATARTADQRSTFEPGQWPTTSSTAGGTRSHRSCFASARSA